MTYLDLVQALELKNEQHMVLCEMAMQIDRLERNVREGSKEFAEKVSNWQKRIESDDIIHNTFSYPNMLLEITKDQTALGALFHSFRITFKVITGMTLEKAQEELVEAEGEGVPSISKAGRSTPR